MSRKKKFHFIYKTTCNTNDKFYYGMHSTNNLNDGYLGSGTRLWHSIKAHGRENHSIEILEYLDNRDSLKAREKELVNEDMLNDPMCMNLALGGGGGFRDTNHQLKCSTAGGIANANRLKCDPGYRKKVSEQMTITNIRAVEEGTHFTPDWTGRKHKEETKEKIRETFKDIKHQQGSNNSQFGTCWVYNLKFKESKKISKIELNQYLESGWTKGRKQIFKT